MEYFSDNDEKDAEITNYTENEQIDDETLKNLNIEEFTECCFEREKTEEIVGKSYYSKRLYNIDLNNIDTVLDKLDFSNKLSDEDTEDELSPISRRNVIRSILYQKKKRKLKK